MTFTEAKLLMKTTSSIFNHDPLKDMTKLLADTDLNSVAASVCWIMTVICMNKNDVMDSLI